MALAFKFISAPVALDNIRVTSKFGERKHPTTGGKNNHEAIDIAAARGTPLLAVYPGRVVKAGVISESCGEGVIIAHKTNASEPNTETYTTGYCHMVPGSTAEAQIQINQTVVAGQIIGKVGTSGFITKRDGTTVPSTTAPHLHFTLKRIRRQADVPGEANLPDVPIDPEPYINDVLTRWRVPQQIERIPPANIKGITPYIQSIESFHPNIQYELTRRRVSAETANVYTPFVKLTSLSRVLPDNLDEDTDAYLPSLGIHGENSVSFENIYSIQSDKSTIGYAITADGARTIPVLVADASKDARNIPIPGITQINAERSTAGPMGVRGGLLKADVKIVAYSVGQVDALLRYFLRPGTRVILELGRMSSNQTDPNEKLNPIDWKKAVNGTLKIGNTQVDIETYFGELIKDANKQKEFIQQYVYKNNGNYETFIAYVVKFNLKYNKNNTFEIDLTLHSVQQFEVPTKHTAVQSTCPNPTAVCKTMDIQEYFSEGTSWKDNSFAKLMSYYQRSDLSANDSIWKNQIVPIKNKNSDSIGAGSTQAGTRENEYFVTWQFFVEKILNDTTLGIASMLGTGTAARELATLALLRPTEEVTGSLDKGLIANQVGYHPNLRSVNPNVMLIYNTTAQTDYEQSSDYPRYKSVIKSITSEFQEVSGSITSNELYDQIKRSSFSFQNLLDKNQRLAGASSLHRGIWLNTKAIKQAFTSTDTVSSAISMLLNMMNAATEGYWNLQLYSTDVNVPGMHVIDMGLSKEPTLISGTSLRVDEEEAGTTNILDSVNQINLTRYQGATVDEPRYVYMFNRGTKRFRDGELGSDLIDLNVEFNLPQVIAVQAIANIGGPAQKPLLSSINVKELQDITLIKNLYTNCNTSTACSPEQQCLSDEIQSAREAVTFADQAAAAAIANQGGGGILTERVFGRVTPTTPAPANRAYRNAVTARRAAEDELTLTEVNQYNPNLVSTVREYADLGTVLDLVEINPSRMMKKLNLDSTGAFVCENSPPSNTHAFNSSNLTKTVVDITLPGVGGIGLFQTFLVDRIPSILDRGYYVVTKVVHEFSSQGGWITKIQGRFRFRPENTSSTSTPTGAGSTGTPSQTVEARPRTTSPTTTSSAQRTQPTLNSSVSNFRNAPVNNPLGSQNTTLNQFLNNNRTGR